MEWVKTLVPHSPDPNAFKLDQIVGWLFHRHHSPKFYQPGWFWMVLTQFHHILLYLKPTKSHKSIRSGDARLLVQGFAPPAAPPPPQRAAAVAATRGRGDVAGGGGSSSKERDPGGWSDGKCTEYVRNVRHVQYLLFSWSSVDKNMLIMWWFYRVKNLWTMDQKGLLGGCCSRGESGLGILHEFGLSIVEHGCESARFWFLEAGEFGFKLERLSATFRLIILSAGKEMIHWTTTSRKTNSTSERVLHRLLVQPEVSVYTLLFEAHNQQKHK